MKKNKKLNRGFSLIELIMTIAITSIIFGIGGYYIINIINNAQDKNNKIAQDNIEKSARIYVTEYIEQISWQYSKEDELNNKKIACISINELINKNLLKKDISKDKNIPKYIIVTKDQNENIISEKLDNEGLCTNETTAVKIPTKKYCNDLTFDGNNHELASNKSEEENFYFNESSNTGTYAKSYTVEAVLKEGYHWTDGTNTKKTITCTIKKATPTLFITPQTIPQNELTIGKKNITIQSNVKGTISFKTSNPNFLNASLESPNITAGENKNITINILATRNTNSYITFTLTPEDSKNYTNISKEFKINKVTLKQVETPTTKYCTNAKYNGSTINLVNLPNKDDGFNFYNYQAINIGEYEIIAELKYGYIWDDNTTENKTIKCSILNPNMTLNYDNQNGSGCTSKTVTYGKTYGDLCIPVRNGHMFTGWFTNDNKQITKNTKVNILEDHTVYAHWKQVSCTISFNGTLGNNNWYKKDKVTVKLTPNNYNDSDILEKGLTTSNTHTFNNKDSTTQSDTKSTTWYGYIKDKNGNVITCENTLKVDTTPPTCKNSGGNSNWTNQNVTITGSCSDDISGCVENTIKNIYKNEINTTKATPGTVYDNAGNQKICPEDQTVKIDKTAPTCKNSGGNTSWTKNNITLIGTCSDTGGSGCTKNIEKTFTTDVNTNKATPGTVYDKAGNKIACPSNQTVKIDKTKPAKPTITNPTNGNETQNSFKLTVSSSDTGSGITKWQFNFINSENKWYSYNNSAKDTFTTTDFSKPRNELVAIRACDVAGNCSNYNTTTINISKYKILNNNYIVCPSDQLKPSRESCTANINWDTLFVNDLKLTNSTLTGTIKMHMNNYYVSYNGYNPTRHICLAKSSNNECKITIHAFSIGSPSWTYKGAYPINKTFSLDLSSLEAGTYKIIVDGVDTIYRFRDTPYILDTIQVK